MGITKDVKGDMRSGRDTYNYASDRKNNGEKVLACGTVNGLLDTPDEVAKEIFALEDTYKGDGQATAHLIYVWHVDDGIPTHEQAQDTANQIMKDLGYSGPATWHMHQNEDGIQGAHIHMTASRISPEPDEAGEYKLHLYDGVQKWEDGQTNRYECLHHSMAVLCERHGWRKLDNMLFDENGAKLDRPEDPDKLKYPKGIREWETHNGGVEHPWTKAAKESVKIFRESKDADEFFKAMADKGMSFRITDKMNEKTGRISWGGVIKGPGDETIRLSQLPKDCSIKCWFEKFGKTEAGDKNTPVPGAGKEFKQGQLTVKAVKTYARKCFKAAGSMEEAETMLAQKEMSVERYGKTGAYLCYKDMKIKLSDLGKGHSLFQLEKRYKGQGSNNNATLHKSQSAVNALSYKDAMNMQAGRASDRASTAAERAVSIAGEAVQAKSVMEALDDAEMQAFALDSARRASAQAAQATARAEAAERRARNLEKALKTRQQPEITHKTEVKKMKATDYSYKNTTEYTYNPKSQRFEADNGDSVKLKQLKNIEFKSGEGHDFADAIVADPRIPAHDVRFIVNFADAEVKLPAHADFYDSHYNDFDENGFREASSIKIGDHEFRLDPFFLEADIDALAEEVAAEEAAAQSTSIEDKAAEKLSADKTAKAKIMPLSDSDWADDCRKINADNDKWDFDINLEFSAPVSGTTDNSTQGNAPADGQRLR